MKGLVIAKKYEPVYVRIRMHDHFDYFAGRREEIYIDSQKKIARWWKKMKLKIKKKVAKKKVEEAAPVDKKIRSKLKPYIEG